MRSIHQIRFRWFLLSCGISAKYPQVSKADFTFRRCLHLLLELAFENLVDVSLQWCVPPFPPPTSALRLYHFAFFLGGGGVILFTSEQHKQSQKKTCTAGTCNLSDEWNTWFSGGVAATFLSRRQPSISSFA